MHCKMFEDYFADSEGMVYNKKNRKQVKMTRSNNDWVINVKTFGLWKTFSAAFVILSLKDPLGEYDLSRASIEYVDKNSNNLNPSNLRWIYSDYTPVHSVGINCDESTFVDIPGIKGYRINLRGDVKNLKTGLVKKPFLTKMTKTASYWFTDTWTNNKAHRIGIHRLIALAFLPHPHDVSDLVINHKNGDGTDNQLSNLEWCTRAHNNEHAVETGLRTENHALETKNVIRGDIVTHRSWKKCAEYLGLSAGALHGRVWSCGGIAVINGHIVRKASDKEWPDLKEEIVITSKEKVSVDVVCIDYRCLRKLSITSRCLSEVWMVKEQY